MDALPALDLIAQCAAATSPGAQRMLDVGCGGGNFTLKLLQRLANLDVTLIDLSRPMLDRATKRISQATAGRITAHQGDVRDIDLDAGRFDILIASAVLHHLRGPEEWEAVFAKFHRWLRPGGSVWIFDYIEHDIPAVQAVMHERYRQHLARAKGEAFRDNLLAYIAKEDSPRSLTFQLDLLRRTGFVRIDVLHKNGTFAAFGAVK